jgi:NAD(P)-dependent dehydrogenase (short-subunit alcohol dehydrogenase family)
MDGGFVKIIVIGANGTIGKYVKTLLTQDGHEVISVGKTSGDFQIDLEDAASVAALYRRIGKFDAVASAAGEVAFAPFEELSQHDWNLSVQSKLLGQVRLVQEALPYIADGGSFTLMSGMLGEEFIRSGVAASMINGGVEGFVRAAARELPRGLRINVISPALLDDSLEAYGHNYPGFKTVSGQAVAQAFKKSIFGVQSGAVLRVH